MTAAMIRAIKRLFIASAAIILLPLLATAQARPASDPPQVPALDEVTISPSRVELVMTPGTEKTVVINLIYSSVTGKSAPTRVFAYLGDWSISREGKILFYNPGTQPNSASPWLIYSPTEERIEPGKQYPIRVTISVPKDATPGDHLAALFVEPRADEIKIEKNRKQVRMKFRLASVFYIMIPQLTRNGSLEGLRAEGVKNGISIFPLLKNTGNSHVRPIYSVKIVDTKDAVMAETDDLEALPVLAESETEHPIFIEKEIPPGNYTVRYKVAFGDAGAATEGHTDIVIKGQVASKPQAAKVDKPVKSAEQ